MPESEAMPVFEPTLENADFFFFFRVNSGLRSSSGSGSEETEEGDTVITTTTGQGIDYVPIPGDAETSGSEGGSTTTESDSNKRDCEESDCPSDKILRTGLKVSETEVDKSVVCCRNKLCVDWTEEECKSNGRIIKPGRDRLGTSMDDCCIEDTTSYQKWCIGDSTKMDGTNKKTRSPPPFWGKNEPRHTAAGQNSANCSNLGLPLTTAKRQCEQICDDISNCHSFWLSDQGRCCPKRDYDDKAFDGGGYEIYDKHDSGGDFYIKASGVPEDKRTLHGKVVGVDEDYCPFRYISIYGIESTGMHIMPNTISSNNCRGPGGKTPSGKTIGNSNNSKGAIVSYCSDFCDETEDCVGFWAYLAGENMGRCCLKSNHGDNSEARLKKILYGGHFIKVEDGIPGGITGRPSNENIFGL